MSKDFDEMMKTYTERYSKICIDNNQIDASLFDEFGVKRGLRDKNGKGVLSGITNISLIKSSEKKMVKPFHVMDSSTIADITFLI